MTPEDEIAAQLTDPIPNLLDKQGGLGVLKPIVVDFCSRLMSTPATRRCYGDTPLPQVIEHSLAMFSLVLGKPVADYDFSAMQRVFRQNQITQHAYEQIVGAMRQALMAGRFGSREACIAVNVLDIYCEHLFGINALRDVKSPFAGIDRRKRARARNTAGPDDLTQGETA